MISCRVVPAIISTRRFKLALAFLVWNALGLVIALQLYSASNFAGRAISLGQLLRWQLIDCNAWALLTPAIFWLTRRFFPDGTAKSMLRTGLVHCGAAAVCVFLQPLIVTVLQQAIPAMGTEIRTFALTYAYALNMYFVLLVLVYAQVFLVALVVESFRRYRTGRERAERLERHLAEARLEALQMQLQPHFLFNTLNAIASLIHSNPAQADKMVSRLGDLLRAALNHSHLHEVTLAEELAFLQKYLDIEQVRFGDRLKVHFDIDDRARDVLVPNLILQPLVENAIRHGISQRPGPGRIEITARTGADETTVDLEVCDDGVGLLASNQAGSGVGLDNTRARLEQLYGNEAFRLELEPRKGGGVRAALTIPLIREPVADLSTAADSPVLNARGVRLGQPLSQSPTPAR